MTTDPRAAASDTRTPRRVVKRGEKIDFGQHQAVAAVDHLVGTRLGGPPSRCEIDAVGIERKETRHHRLGFRAIIARRRKIGAAAQAVDPSQPDETGHLPDDDGCRRQTGNGHHRVSASQPSQSSRANNSRTNWSSHSPTASETIPATAPSNRRDQEKRLRRTGSGKGSSSAGSSSTMTAASGVGISPGRTWLTSSAERSKQQGGASSCQTVSHQKVEGTVEADVRQR